MRCTIPTICDCGETFDLHRDVGQCKQCRSHFCEDCLSPLERCLACRPLVKTYVKNPIFVNAIQFNGLNFNSVQNFTGGGVRVGSDKKGVRFLEIQTLEGDMRATVGDYIIRGVENEFYPCKESIFNKTYTLKS